MSTFYKNTKSVTVRPRNKRLRECNTGSSSRTTSSSGSVVIESHTHSNLEDLEKLSVSDQTLLINSTDATVANATHATSSDTATSATSATTASIANGLSSTGISSIRDNFLSKDQDDGTEHSLYVNGEFTVSDTFQVEPNEGQVLITGPLEASGLGTVSTSGSETNYLLGINSSGDIKQLPSRITYKNAALTLGSNTGSANVDLYINGNLSVSGTMEFNKLTADEAEITKFSCGSESILGDKIDLSYGTNGIIAFDYGLTEESAGLVAFFSKPDVMHYEDGSWNDYSVLDLSDVVEEIDSDDITDKVVTDRAVDSFVKDYVEENAVTPLDVTVLATEGGTITSCMKNLLHQPLYVKSDDSYASAKLLCKSGGSTSIAWLLWDVVTSSEAYPKTIRHYAMELTGANGGAVPYQTDGTILAYNLFYRDETNTWNPA